MDSKYLHFTVREGGLIHETKLTTVMQELELKMQGGGIIAGFYSVILFLHFLLLLACKIS